MTATSDGGTNDADEVLLHGGVANAGAVTRRGAFVFRPANPHTSTIHRALRAVHEHGFRGASVPVGIAPDGREQLWFVDGDVPVPPYPAWAQTDEALVSVARLIRRLHDASTTFVRSIVDDTDVTWSDEMADPVAGSLGRSDELVLCHTDVCLENVVFRDGRAVALLDFDFASPGRRVFDLAAFARMCVPIDDPSRVRFGWTPADLPARLRRVADAYGLDPMGREELLGAIDASIATGGTFVLRRVEAGDPNFIAMWESMGGMARFDERRAWWHQARREFAAALDR